MMAQQLTCGITMTIIFVILAMTLPMGKSLMTRSTESWHNHYWNDVRGDDPESRRINVFNTNLQMTSSYTNKDSEQVESSSTTRKKSKNKNRIIACSSTKELAHAVSTYVQSHHKVAELGSQLREVSTSICENVTNEDGGQVVLVDIQRAKVSTKDTTKKKQSPRTSAMRLQETDSTQFYPDVATFIEIPQLQDWSEAFFEIDKDDENMSYDIFVLDVNSIVGNDLEWTSLSIIQQFESMNKNIADKNSNDDKELIVLVKSIGLTQFGSRLVHSIKWEGTDVHKSAISPPHIVATVGVQEYRNTIPATVTSKDDVVLEVGCHFGTSTAILKAHSNHVLGVDVGSKIIKQAQQKYPGIPFRVGNAWKTAELLRLQQECLNQDNSKRKIGFDVVYVDVGGLSGSDGLLESINLISSIRYALEPRTIVIKSACMQRLSSKLVPFWQILKKEQERQSGSTSD